MFEQLEGRLTGLGDALAGIVEGLDSDALSAETADRAWASLDRLERLASAGKVVLARRVAQAPLPLSGPGSGARTPAESIAARAGTGLGAAREALETSHRLGHSDALDRAVRAGQLSAPQAAVIASAVVADPSAAERLVALAGTMSLAELREECARVRAAADPDPGARNARLHRARRLRRFTDPEGAWQLLARGTPQAGAAFNAVLDPLIDQIFQAARRAGRAEALEAYAFDALMALADLAAGEQPECLRGPTPSQGPAGGDGPVSPPTDGRAPVTGPRVPARTTPSPQADGTAACAPQPSPGHADAPADASNPLPDGTSRGVVPRTTSPAGLPSSDTRQDPSSPSRRLDDLPWWAAAQGLLLDPTTTAGTAAAPGRCPAISHGPDRAPRLWPAPEAMPGRGRKPWPTQIGGHGGGWRTSSALVRCTLRARLHPSHVPAQGQPTLAPLRRARLPRSSPVQRTGLSGCNSRCLTILWFRLTHPFRRTRWRRKARRRRRRRGRTPRGAPDPGSSRRQAGDAIPGIWLCCG